MVRHVADNRTPGWKALLAIVVGGGAVLWHVLACMESPMSFSPSGKDLAFVTMEPYGLDKKDLMRKDRYVYRLFVASQGAPPRVIEQTNSFMLCAPAYTSDGEQLVYLRIPLFREENLEKLNALVEQRKEAIRGLTESAVADWGPWAAATQPSESSTTRPGWSSDGPAGPSLEGMQRLVARRILGPDLPCTLVVRDAKTFEEITTITVPLPLIEYEESYSKDDAYAMSYLLVKPILGPKDAPLFLCAAELLLGIDVDSDDWGVLATGAKVAALSPDGRWVAFLTDESVGFVRTDGGRTVYRRWKEDTSAGIAWVDAETLALLTERDDKPVLQMFHPDGSLGPVVPLAIEEDSDHAQLAIAPNRKHIVVSNKKEVFFLNGKGKLVRRWTAKADTEGMLVQPTFRPDSRQVAFKFLQKDEQTGYGRVVAIAFFTPEGKEISRVKIPPVDRKLIPTTRPTTHPATRTVQ